MSLSADDKTRIRLAEQAGYDDFRQSIAEQHTQGNPFLLNSIQADAWEAGRKRGIRDYESKGI